MAPRPFPVPAAVATLILLVLALSGCVPSTPDQDTWRFDARQAVSDVASEVSSTRLVILMVQQDRVPGSYAVVSAAASEEAGGKAAQKLTAYQPPGPEQQRATGVSDTLDTANGVLTDARIALQDGDEATYPQLLKQLARAGAALERWEQRLTRPARTVPQWGER